MPKNKPPLGKTKGGFLVSVGFIFLLTHYDNAPMPTVGKIYHNRDISNKTLLENQVHAGHQSANPHQDIRVI